MSAALQDDGGRDAPFGDFDVGEPPRLPPHDLEAERKVLGSIIIDPERLPEVAGLEPEHFYSEAHRQTWIACRALIEQGRSISIETVADQLRTTGRLAQVGGLAYVIDLHVLNAIYPKQQLADLLGIVLRTYRERQALLVAAQLDAQVRAGIPGAAALAISSLQALAPKPAEEDGILFGAELAERLPDIPWLCAGLKITAGAHTLVSGNAYSGKSLAMQDLQLAVASGGDVFGTFRCTRGRVIGLDYDGQGRRITQERAQRLARARGLDLRELDKSIAYKRRPGFYLDDPDALEKLLRLIDGFSLCVVDSWRGATPNTDEWKRGPVQVVTDRLEAASTKSGCVIIAIDHLVKPSRDGATSRSSMHDVHGSTAKSETPQSLFNFAGDEGNSQAHVTHKKERATGKTISPFALRFEDIEDHGDPRWGLRVVYVDRAETAAGSGKAKLDAVVASVRDCIRDNPGIAGAEAVRTILGTNAALVRAAVNTLLAEGEVVERKVPGKGKGRRLYITHMAPPEGP
jgi:YD repeat-containing protein